MSTQELFLEIGAEEFPAGYIAPAVEQLTDLLQKSLATAAIACGQVHTFATPRRLGVVIENVATQGQDRTEEVLGPPVNVAFNNDGSPRVAAQKFADKVGVSVEKLERKATPKGDYLFALQVEKGVSTLQHLNEQIPVLLGQLSFPKTMRWGRETQTFARPIHWICARLGSHPLDFRFASVQSGVQSWGHRFLAPGPFAVESYAQFQETCRKHYVLINPEERKAVIVNQGQELAKQWGGRPWVDEDLVTLNAYLTEYPVPLIAHYEPHYLHLPKELLRTSMRHHLKCFVITDEKGELIPHFMAITNLPSRAEDKVRGGYQRVLRARLADAEFFFQEDRKQPLDQLNQRLEGVIYQSKLGTYKDKVNRICALVPVVAQELGLDTAIAQAERAALLSKADLVSKMVFEFPELQGIMGRHYALHQGEDTEVATAIQEHYLPAGQDDPLPTTNAGKIVAVAERLDTLVGGFGVGLKPTGSKDQYGLRRQSIGLLRILKEYKLPGKLSNLLAAAASTLADRLTDPRPVVEEVLQYVVGRLVQILKNEDWPRDQVDAICTPDLVSRYPIHQLHDLLQSLQQAVESGLLAGLAYSFKRVNNILRAAVKKNEVTGYPGLGSLLFSEDAPPIDTSLLESGREQELYDRYLSVCTRVEQALAQADFQTGLRVLLELREPIDNLFDKVMVMAEDNKLRANRLLLMRGIARLAFLDFTRIDTEDAEVSA